MKKSHVSHRGLFLLFFAVLCSVGVQRAQADETIVPGLTGTTSVFVGGFGSPGLPGDTSITGLQGYFDSTAIVFSLNGLPSNNSFFGQQCQDFPSYTMCTFQWSGTYSGGSVSIVANNGQIEYDSTGTITGGSFSGDETCFTDFPCSISLQQTVDFTSTWTNGWRSDGTLLVDSVGGYAPSSYGTLNMTTVTPEPGSMILVASGIFFVAVFLHRRRACNGTGAPTLDFPYLASNKRC